MGFAAAAFLTMASLAAAESKIYTGRHALRIPFEYQPEMLKQLRATEVRLLVSTDRGKSWNTAAKAQPNDRLFRYNAADNGEYWFAVQLVDSQSRPVQPGAIQVGLKVHVDDTAPTLDIKVRELGPGRVELKWQADDEALDLSTLQFKYRVGETGEWEAVDGASAAVGQTDLFINEATTLYVAGRVSDLAKNEVTVSANTTTKAASAPGTTTEPDFSEPVADLRPLRVSELPRVNPHVAPSPLQSARPTPQPISQSSNSPIQVTPSASHHTSPYPTGTKVIHTTSFNLGYALDQVGPSGVGAVDLYITEDNGRSWFHYGSDPDKSSPFTVSLRKSGQYGFSIRARSGIGLSIDPPIPGDLPDTMIVIDTVPPRPKLNSFQQGLGPAHNQLQINWTLIENDLPAQPVLLSYAYSPTGPWEPISGWVENSGRYLWTVDTRITSPIFIRIEARDLAGNVAHVDSEQAIPIDLTKPTARIVDIETSVQ